MRKRGLGGPKSTRDAPPETLFLPRSEISALGFSGLLGSMLDFPFGQFLVLRNPPFPGPPQVVKFQPKNGSEPRHGGAFSTWRMHFRPQ